MKRLYILFIVLMTCSTVSAQIIGDRVVKIIRVSFQEDDADGTTGNGDFLYTAEYDTCDNYVVDPAPHE